MFGFQFFFKNTLLDRTGLVTTRHTSLKREKRQWQSQVTRKHLRWRALQQYLTAFRR